ncbi:hypothetical protein [Tenggerimyces flavus]|uniref:Uncharacterized protein n=1 Tax=Tenggerimyces flavus TaxID=1708749 RepID=A0ABV7YFQ7_9ACTN|nr:hypothetical protein [Tenggerimyces flavus]MBM7788016.1 hypothetical protein [Tenggerimyces flavus]
MEAVDARPDHRSSRSLQGRAELVAEAGLARTVDPVDRDPDGMRLDETGDASSEVREEK